MSGPGTGEGATRRELARRGLLAGGAALAATAGPAVLGASRAFGQEGEDTSDSDGEILIGLIGFEQQMAVAYAQAAASGTLGPGTAAAKLFLGQEIAHSHTLIGQLTKIGGEPLPRPLPEGVPGLSEAKSAEEYLNLLVRLENQLVAAYLEGQKLLGSAELLRTCAQICADEGQHLVVLRQALGADPIPGPLPSGTEHA